MLPPNVLISLGSVLPPASIVKLLYFIGSLWVLYGLITILYNISRLHPLSKFPGPKLAAATLYYEAWFDFIKVGRYTRKIGEMHNKYGPIVRISPSELHCNDPSFIPEIYASGGRKRNKDPHTYRSMISPIDKTAFATEDHDLHRIRRAPIAKYFSRQSTLQLEAVVLNQLEHFCKKLLSCQNGAAFDITTAYSCFTSDVISTCCFGEPLGFLAQSGWEPNWRRPTYSFLDTIFLLRFFPILRRLVRFGNFLALHGWLGSDIKMVLHTIHVRIPTLVSKAPRSIASGSQQTLYTHIQDSNGLPESERSPSRLSAESMALLNAGTETTAWALSVITFYLLSQPEILHRLTRELNQTNPEQKTWQVLEKLPYLSGVVMEGLRLSYGVSGRTPRIATQEELVFKGKAIPKGWAIGMSSAVMHHNEDIFPDSGSFLPDRWIDSRGNKRCDLEKYILSFSRGSRQCLGIQ
ncbi:hypothetical protein KVR01_001939 [Diaporthe batatas]|uniref:uncharacterized protein n=1 Tax=Diaporthe batatas TaxID=748121 RepID=UPI001D055D95|nr:uncharacterized protein KVR01_001939 [Diaporthe batatas]KAG8169190.1 hypothetical protein KVR01_001939 [Diaporthe batatas]